MFKNSQAEAHAERDEMAEGSGGQSSINSSRSRPPKPWLANFSGKLYLRHEDGGLVSERMGDENWPERLWPITAKIRASCAYEGISAVASAGSAGFWGRSLDPPISR
jgi:hypothetical protein